MKIPWKAIGILGVLIATLIYDLPTVWTFMSSDPAATLQQLETRKGEITKQYLELKGLSLALAEPKKNRILLLADDNFTYPLKNPSIARILDENFVHSKTEEGDILTLNESHDRDIFVSKIALQLNSLFTNVRKITAIELNDRKDSIRFVVEKTKRLSPLSEPLVSMLKDDLEISYVEDLSEYVTYTKPIENTVNLGLDLQGGMYLDVGVKVDEVIKAVMVRLAEELENNLIDDNINYESIRVIEDQIIEIVLAEDEEFDFTGENYTRLLGRNFDLIPGGNKFTVSLVPEEETGIKKRAIEQALETIRNRIDQLGVKEPSIQRQGEDSIIIQLPGLKDPQRARRVIDQVAELKFMAVSENGSVSSPGKDQVVLFQENRDPITKEIISTTPFLLNKKVMMKGDRIRDARVSFQQTGVAYVTMSFDDLGKTQFGEVTTQMVGRRLAIVLDGNVQSAPRVNEKITGGEAQISGNFTPEEASELALVLRSGALPAPIVIHEERTVGASLGEDSIRQSLIAFAIGFIGVIIFMIFYYHVAGLFSVLALLFNMAIIVAALAYFQATLTLPGMAGIILTVGMAVDANVLIFERIREEIAKGTPIRGAINTGFNKATITILDSNITTILAAIVLFQFGTGPIKGFSVTLSIGILGSMFTSIVVGRFLFEITYLKKKILEDLSI